MNKVPLFGLLLAPALGYPMHAGSVLLPDGRLSTSPTQDCGRSEPSGQLRPRPSSPAADEKQSLAIHLRLIAVNSSTGKLEEKAEHHQLRSCDALLPSD